MPSKKVYGAAAPDHAPDRVSLVGEPTSAAAAAFTGTRSSQARLAATPTFQPPAQVESSIVMFSFAKV